jgi:hypothetical protein
MLQEVFAMETSSRGTKIAFSAHVFVALKDFVLDNLWLGLFVSQVMAKHRRNVKELVEIGGNLTRDTFLCEQVTRSQVTGWNPLEGFHKVKLRKLRLGGTLPASNSRKG